MVRVLLEDVFVAAVCGAACVAFCYLYVFRRERDD